ncbi:shikimate dehydrogenase [Leucobacter ruminantium]|uniref:Shikimate dehydrogenase n=1 Tax=Leucobacter ruminantium TaxID=1289170 RepID=A0A939LUJ0_9MICO|nr:shikimate dehydrogenase [Leucobacter ruminantium]MBO1804641.1 shikimate dehydrogenase [Leucobacter ruminantium]
MAERLAVLGSPIAHSKSPAIHAAAYERLALDWRYGRQQLEAAELADFLASRGPQWRGFSVTMPLKEEAHRLSTVLDPIAEESGVVNTLLRIASDTSGAPRWAGFNTDVAGLAMAISNAGLDATSTVVIGSGATAVSAILAARRLGARHVEVVARNVDAVGRLVARFGETREPGSDSPLHVSGTVLPHAVNLIADIAAVAAAGIDARIASPTLVISTLPGPAGAELALPTGLTEVPLFDVAYDPWPSPLAARWRDAGGTAHAGTEMLVEQALAQVRIFVGGDPSIALEDEPSVLAAMRAASVGG